MTSSRVAFFYWDLHRVALASNAAERRHLERELTRVGWGGTPISRASNLVGRYTDRRLTFRSAF